MGLITMVCAIVFLFHSGTCWEKQRYMALTKTELKITAVIDVIVGIYFMVATIGYFAP